MCETDRRTDRSCRRDALDAPLTKPSHQIDLLARLLSTLYTFPHSHSFDPSFVVRLLTPSPQK